MSRGDSRIPEELRERRQHMLERDLAGRDIDNPAVLRAMAEVRRHEFLPPALRIHSYDDAPVRIGCGQTISQPYVVAFMTQHLHVKPGMRVLEIGTGSGYQAAVLAAMDAEVFTIERYEDLSLAAEKVIDKLGYGDRVCMLVDDGTLGWPEEAPFDRILVTAAGPRLPKALVEQLVEGGLLLMPVGRHREPQKLILAEKRDGKIIEREILDVSFVPLVGEDGFNNS